MLAAIYATMQLYKAKLKIPKCSRPAVPIIKLTTFGL